MTVPAPRPEIRTLAPGEHEVVHGDRTSRVYVPAGVGVPGLDELDLVTLVVEVLLERGPVLPDVLDLSHLLGTDPALWAELDRRAEELG
jgi:hypothetical protein